MGRQYRDQPGTAHYYLCLSYPLVKNAGLIIGIPVGMIIKALFEQGVFEKSDRNESLKS